MWSGFDDLFSRFVVSKKWALIVAIAITDIPLSSFLIVISGYAVVILNGSCNRWQFSPSQLLYLKKSEYTPNSFSSRVYADMSSE
jgi:hypothetical protein